MVHWSSISLHPRTHKMNEDNYWDERGEEDEQDEQDEIADDMLPADDPVLESWRRFGRRLFGGPRAFD